MRRPEPMLRQRKARERAALLPLIGLVLLLPPFAGLFAMDSKLFGLPVALIYLFVAWAGLIFGAWRLSRALQDEDDL